MLIARARLDAGTAKVAAWRLRTGGVAQAPKPGSKRSLKQAQKRRLAAERLAAVPIGIGATAQGRVALGPLLPIEERSFFKALPSNLRRMRGRTMSCGCGSGCLKMQRLHDALQGTVLALAELDVEERVVLIGCRCTHTKIYSAVFCAPASRNKCADRVHQCGECGRKNYVSVAVVVQVTRGSKCRNV